MSAGRFPTGGVRWGILGCGEVAEIMSGPALQNAARSTVTAVMRRDGAKAADFARRHGIGRWHDDAGALIADDEVDAVYVATPPDSHAEYAIRALEAGKPVLCEKPMALTTADCDRMAAAAEAAGLPLITAYYRRALPRFERMRELIQTGAIGTPRTVEARQFKPETSLPNQAWKLDPKVSGGGHFADMYSHVLDWLDWVFGPARAVHGFVRRQGGAYAAEDLVAFVIDQGEVAVSGLCSYAADREEDRVTVNGTEGSISTAFYAPAPVRLVRAGDAADFEFPVPRYNHQAFAGRVVACLLDGAPNPCDPAAARRAVATVAAIYAG